MRKPSETAGASLRRLVGALSLAGCSVRWYVKEVVGENDYEHYLQHMRSQHGGAEPVKRRDFERAKTDRMESNPKSRCC